MGDFAARMNCKTASGLNGKWSACPGGRKIEICRCAMTARLPRDVTPNRNIAQGPHKQQQKRLNKVRRMYPGEHWHFPAIALFAWAICHFCQYYSQHTRSIACCRVMHICVCSNSIELLLMLSLLIITCSHAISRCMGSSRCLYGVLVMLSLLSLSSVLYCRYWYCTIDDRGFCIALKDFLLLGFCCPWPRLDRGRSVISLMQIQNLVCDDITLPMMHG